MPTVYQMEYTLVADKHATDYSLYILSKDKSPAEYRLALENFVEYSQRKDELDKLQTNIDKLEQAYNNYTPETVTIVTLEELAMYKDTASIDTIWDLHQRYCDEEYRNALEILLELRENPKQYDFILEKYGDMIFDNTKLRATFLISELCERGYETLESLERADPYKKKNNTFVYLCVLEEIARSHDYKKATGQDFYKLNLPESIYIPFITH